MIDPGSASLARPSGRLAKAVRCTVMLTRGVCRTTPSFRAMAVADVTSSHTMRSRWVPASMVVRVLHVTVVRELLLSREARRSQPCHLSAASGLARVGKRLYVVADDENALGVFDLANDRPGTRARIFDGDLPLAHGARKAAKPDLEALTVLPPFAGYPFGALMAIGSGSRPARHRAALLALSAQGDIAAPVRAVDLAPLYAPLRSRFAELNVEGAFLTGGSLCLLQRGHRGAAVNASIAFAWSEVEHWLVGSGPAPQATSESQFQLGAIASVPLCFTDGCAMADGGWVFCASAEDTVNSYADGRCLGSAIGVVGASGTLERLQPLDLVCKVEGIVVARSGSRLDVLMVTDADDRSRPALLLSATLMLD